MDPRCKHCETNPGGISDSDFNAPSEIALACRLLKQADLEQRIQMTYRMGRSADTSVCTCNGGAACRYYQRPHTSSFNEPSKVVAPAE